MLSSCCGVKGIEHFGVVTKNVLVDAFPFSPCDSVLRTRSHRPDPNNPDPFQYLLATLAAIMPCVFEQEKLLFNKNRLST